MFAHLQCGVAVRTLREEIPKVFEHDLTYDIYREDITFVDNISNLPGGAMMVTHGKVSVPTMTTCPLVEAAWQSLSQHACGVFAKLRLLSLRAVLRLDG